MVGAIREKETARSIRKILLLRALQKVLGKLTLNESINLDKIPTGRYRKTAAFFLGRCSISKNPLTKKMLSFQETTTNLV